MAPFSKKTARTEKKIHRRGVSFWRGLLVMVVSIFVTILIVLSLWVSIGAIIQKIKISHGISQIIDIVDMSRRYASLERDIGATGREDILDRIERNGLIEASGRVSDGLKTVVNPWGGTLAAFTIPGNFFRLETVVPSRTCVRIIDLLTENTRSLGLKQIDAKGIDESWRQIYSEKNQSKLGSAEISAGCRSDQLVILDLTFTLR